MYVIGRDYQTAEIDVTDAARHFLVWLAGAANPVLTELIQRWIWQPRDVGGLGALLESAEDLALLRREVVASWQQTGSGQDSGETQA